MAYAQTTIDRSKIDGLVVEKEFQNSFEVTSHRDILNDWDIAQGATHRIFVGQLGETKPIKLLKTVLYILQDDEITWVKWQIKTIWKREESA